MNIFFDLFTAKIHMKIIFKKNLYVANFVSDPLKSDFSDSG